MTTFAGNLTKEKHSADNKYRLHTKNKMEKLLVFLGFDAATMTIRKEVIGGITTFLTMAYILAVNPDILSATGMDKGAVFTTTCISAVVGTIVMALYAKLPFALAPGMGLNAFFAFTVVLTMGYSWQFALTAVFIEGIIFVLLTITGLRSYIVNAIPLVLRRAISPGIGLFIAFVGQEYHRCTADWYSGDYPCGHPLGRYPLQRHSVHASLHRAHPLAVRVA